jgi:hypothetical protein
MWTRYILFSEIWTKKVKASKARGEIGNPRGVLEMVGSQMKIWGLPYFPARIRKGQGKIQGLHRRLGVVEKASGQEERQEKAQEVVDEANGQTEAFDLNSIEPTDSGQSLWEESCRVKDDRRETGWDVKMDMPLQRWLVDETNRALIQLPCLGAGTRLGSSRWRRWEGRRGGRIG